MKARVLILSLWVACDQSGTTPEVEFTVPAADAWSQRSEAPPKAVGDLVIITNNFEDSLSYVDLGLDPPAEIARIPVGLNPIEREGPHHLALAPDGKSVWVGLSNYVPGSGSGPHGAHGAGTADGYAIEVSVDDGHMIDSVRVDRNPGDIRITPDGQRVLVSHFDLLRITEAEPGSPPSAYDSRLAIIDRVAAEREAMVEVCPAAHGIAIAPGSDRAYIACWDDHIADIDLASATHPVSLVAALPLPGTIANPECQPYALTIAPDGKSVWVGCFASGELRAYDPATRTMDAARVVDLGGAALFGAYVDASTLVVPSQGPDRLTWVDAATAEIVHVLDFDAEVCDRPHVVVPTPDGERLVLVCEGDRVSPGTLVVIDAATRTVQHVVPVGLFPDDIALEPAP